MIAFLVERTGIVLRNSRTVRVFLVLKETYAKKVRYYLNPLECELQF